MTGTLYSGTVSILCRLHAGHKFDPQIDRASAELLARRGTQQVEGGYCFTRDYRLNNVSIYTVYGC